MTRLAGTLTALTTALTLASAPLAEAGETGHSLRYDDLTWVPFGEGSPVMVAPLWGDMAAGPSGFLLKMPPGFEVPKHAHSAGYRAVIISGGAQHWAEGEDRGAAAGPGSYVEQPAGAWHFDANPGPGDVVALVIYDGPVDFVFPR